MRFDVSRLAARASAALARLAAAARRRIPARSRWHRRPEALGRELCFFVTLARRGELAPHALVHARAWRDVGFDVVLIVVGEVGPLADATDFAAGVLLRENRGYDFGAWADALRRMRLAVTAADTVVLTNDSVFGPFSTFGPMVSAIREADAGLVGLTRSFEIVPHLQSYLLAFKRDLLRSPVFWRFWRSIRTGERQYVIDNYELKLTSLIEAAGFTSKALYPTPDGYTHNPTLLRWRGLIEDGFPYLKVAVLRDNPCGEAFDDWPALLAKLGYDPDIVGRLLELEGR